MAQRTFISYAALVVALLFQPSCGTDMRARTDKPAVEVAEPERPRPEVRQAEQPAVQTDEPAGGGKADKGKQFAVKITDPARNGVEVDKGMTVRGTASLPDGYHLWVLARREDFEDVWWPQAEGKIDPAMGEWKASVTFGTADDIGKKFDLEVIVVNESGHATLQEYRRRAMATNEWTPISEVPPSASAPQTMKVVKVSNR